MEPTLEIVPPEVAPDRTIRTGVAAASPLPEPVRGQAPAFHGILATPAKDCTDLSKSQSKEAMDRRVALIKASEYLAMDATLAVAAKMANIAEVKLCRLLQLATQIHESDPRTPLKAHAKHIEKAWFLIEGPLARLAPGRSDGRTSDWESLLKLEPFTEKLKTIYIATIGFSHDYQIGRRSAKVATTLERMAEEPECPRDLALKLRTGSQPVCLVRYLRKITPEIEARILGRKHLQLHGVVSRRDDTARLPDGTRIKLLSGFIVELDDMSSNQPFWATGRDGNAILSRQGLYARCRLGRWLGVELVARPREAYRAEDILRFLRKLMLEYGKFDVLRMEQGIWASRKIKGLDVSGSEIELERPGMGQQEQAKLQEGLAGIGVQIKYEKSAHGKGSLESSFNYLQTILATYTTDFVNVGRHAGEFERSAKSVRRARAESHHPADLGFAYITELADRIEKSMAYINARIKGREQSADERWTSDMSKRQLPELKDSDMAVFLPEIREATINGLRVVCKANGVPHDFRHKVFAELGDGYRLWVRFDPSEPALGAAIYNRETSYANTDGRSVGGFIGFARWEMPGPQCDVTHDHGLEVVTTEQLYGVPAVEDDGYSRRKEVEKAVQTAFRALPRPGQPGVKHNASRDGLGHVTESAFATAPKPAPAPERQKAPAPAEPSKASGGFRLNQLLAEQAA